MFPVAGLSAIADVPDITNGDVGVSAVPSNMLLLAVLLLLAFLILTVLLLLLASC